MEDIIFYLVNRIGLPLWVVDIGIIFLGISWVFSQFCARTTTPDPSTKWGRVYKVIEFIGGIYGKAKQAGIVVPQTETVVKSAVEQLAHDIEKGK